MKFRHRSALLSACCIPSQLVASDMYPSPTVIYSPSSLLRFQSLCLDCYAVIPTSVQRGFAPLKNQFYIPHRVEMTIQILGNGCLALGS
ncbi:hypothetical protein BGZ60DRAFT_408701 [Tricladium varicosporioides]|nr:hypothetical protein BGZ60DRAFT_408701 [Hymenoscyphus varicosporioides]